MYHLEIYNEDDGKTIFATDFISVDSLKQELGKFERNILGSLHENENYGIYLESNNQILIEEAFDFVSFVKMLDFPNDLAHCCGCNDLIIFPDQETVCDSCLEDFHVCKECKYLHIN